MKQWILSPPRLKIIYRSADGFGNGLKDDKTLEKHSAAAVVVVAQLAERSLSMQEVRGSNPIFSSKIL